MTVKVIVTDMDGTFLDDAKQYDRDRFQAQFEQLKARDIEFVVASGNPHPTMILAIKAKGCCIATILEFGYTNAPVRHPK